GGLLRLLGRPREGRALLEHALEVALEHDLHEAALRAYWNLMVLSASRDDWADSERFIAGGLELARRAGIRHYESEFFSAGVEPLVERGRWDEAIARAGEVERLAIEDESVWDLSIHTAVAAVLARRGQLEAARERLDRLAPLGSSDQLEMRVAYAATQALLLNAGGSHREALALGRSTFLETGPLGGATNLNARNLLVEALDAAVALHDEAAVEE